MGDFSAAAKMRTALEKGRQRPCLRFTAVTEKKLFSKRGIYNLRLFNNMI